jgi:hypothetical protein
VLKRCLKKGDVPPVWVSEGDLNTEIGEIAPTYDDQPRNVVQLPESALAC